MNKKSLLLAPAVAVGMAAIAAGPAMADHAEGSYSTVLNQINNSGATGEVWIDVDGTAATVTVTASGLAETFMDAPYPHVQHIHIGAQGTCPPPSADTNGDGIVDTPEGQPFYGGIGTTLSTGDAPKGAEAATDITVAPTGSSYTYEETFELNEETQDALEAGTAVVVVHGLDPANQPAAATEKMSSLAPELPLAATAPALCGSLVMQPVGGADTGATVTAAPETVAGNDIGMIALAGGGLLAAAGGAFAVRRRMVENR